ncbi:MAG: hypothetical protein AAB425_11720 [Bdellovibrionota bacterium]
MKRAGIFLGSISLLACATIHAAEYQHPGTLISQAELVFKGTVTRVEYRDFPVAATFGLNVPFTFVTFQIEKTLKGTYTTANTFILKVLGGQSGDRILVPAGFPRFDVGSTELLFVRGNGWSACPLVGCSAGRIRLNGELATSNAGQALYFSPARELLPVHLASAARGNPVARSSSQIDQGLRITELNFDERISPDGTLQLDTALSPGEVLRYFEDLIRVSTPPRIAAPALALSIGPSSAVEPISLADGKPKVVKPKAAPASTPQSRLEELEASELARNNGNPVIRR